MPQFDQWGLIPPGHEGPRGYPLVVIPGSGDHDEFEAPASLDEEESDEGTPPPTHRKLLMEATDDDDDGDQFTVVPARRAGAEDGDHGGTEASEPPTEEIRAEPAAEDAGEPRAEEAHVTPAAEDAGGPRAELSGGGSREPHEGDRGGSGGPLRRLRKKRWAPNDE